MATDYKMQPCAFNAGAVDKLNAFHECFELANPDSPVRAHTALHDIRFTASVAEVKRTFSTVRARNAAGPDGISGKVLKACGEQLSAVFSDIFNTSLQSCTVLKKNKVTCLDDRRPCSTNLHGDDVH